MSKRPTYMTGNGNEMEYGWYHVPVWYSGYLHVDKRGNTRELVVVEIGKNHVVYSHRNDNNYRIGMPKRTSLLQDKSGHYFMYRGKKIHFSKRYGWVQ